MASTQEKLSGDWLNSFMNAAKAGVRKASQSLETFSAGNIQMEVISAGIAPTSRLSEVAGDPESIVVGIYLRVEGDIPGHALLVFPYESAIQMADIIMGSPVGTSSEIDDMHQSALQEVGNIVVSSYLNSLSDFYGKQILPTPPGLAMDMAAAVIDSVLLNTGHYDEDTISIVTRFSGSEHTVRGFFLYIPEMSQIE